MLRDWEHRFPGRIETMFRSLQHVVPSHLADTTLYDFARLEPQMNGLAEEDTLFDPVSYPEVDRETKCSVSSNEFTPSLRRKINILAARPTQRGQGE